jgi:tetratricopeptide (TPR) repeat protein
MEYNRRFSDTDPCWLIKVDAHISGPFSFNEIITKLTTGTLAPHHEAISPLDRWRPLQSQALFVAAIEKLRRRQEEAMEHTMTKTERSNVTKTMDLTGDRLTPTLNQETLTPPPLFKPAPPARRVYSDQSPPDLEPRKENRSFFFLGLGALACVLVVLFFLQNPIKNPPAFEKKTDFVSYFDQGLQFKKTAHWSEALKNFSLAHQLNPKDLDLILEMAPLLIQLEGQTSYARSLVEKAMLGQYKKETIALGQNILGLSQSYESEQNATSYSLALKHFNESLQADAENEYVPAMINKGWLLAIQGRFGEAESVLIKTINKNPYAQTGALYLIENYLLQSQKDNSKSALQKAQQLTTQLVNHKTYDGQQEVLLFHAYLLNKLGGDKTAIQRFIQNGLLLDPDLTNDHVHSPGIDWRGYQWKLFGFVCQDLAKVTTGDQTPLLNFVCKYKGQGVLAAQQFIDGWMSKNSKDPKVYVASAIVSQSVGELEKARESLKMAHKMGLQDKLYYQVLSKVCLKQKDTSCLEDITPHLLKISPLHAYTAMMFVKTDPQTLARGLSESNNYSPLLSLQK